MNQIDETIRVERTVYTGTANGAYIPPKTVPKPAPRLPGFLFTSEG
jgi:hypothetical protein